MLYIWDINYMVDFYRCLLPMCVRVGVMYSNSFISVCVVNRCDWCVLSNTNTKITENNLT